MDFVATKLEFMVTRLQSGTLLFLSSGAPHTCHHALGRRFPQDVTVHILVLRSRTGSNMDHLGMPAYFEPSAIRNPWRVATVMVNFRVRQATYQKFLATQRLLLRGFP